jgi:uncharacterized protein (TIGR03083 family)
LGVAVTDLADAYAEIQSRLTETVLALDEHQCQTRVPACPDWTVADVMAHLAGGMVDVTSGDALELRGMDLLDQWRDEAVAEARDSLTAREVRERRGRSVGSMVGEWRDASEVLLPMLRGHVAYPPDAFPFAGNVLMNDVVVHEGDVREAVGLGVAPEIYATSAALLAYSFSLDSRIRATGLPAIVLRYGTKERVVGDGDTAASVSASRTTLVRMLASRLTSDEIRALEWDGDPEPYLAIIPEYGPTKAGDVP